GQHCPGGGDVHDERADEDRRPHAVPGEQQRGKRDACRRPEGRRTRVEKREVEAELPSDHVQDEDRGKNERAREAPAGLHGGREHLDSKNKTISASASSYSQITRRGASPPFRVTCSRPSASPVRCRSG